LGKNQNHVHVPGTALLWGKNQNHVHVPERRFLGKNQNHVHVPGTTLLWGKNKNQQFPGTTLLWGRIGTMLTFLWNNASQRYRIHADFVFCT
jgi:hypothetical protein